MTETSDTNQNEPRFYLSHPIRGAKGDKATEEDMQKNRIAASIFATKLEWECGLNIYCPAEHDEVISILYRKGLIGEEDILEADCAIIDKCCGLIAFGTDISEGMAHEIEYALKQGKPVLVAIRDFEEFWGLNVKKRNT